MMIARKLAIDELHITEQPLPLDNLDQNFITADALLTAEGLPAQWPKADVIIGNPPFLDARKMTKTQGREYVGLLEKIYPEIPRRADHCVYWIRKAHDHLPACTTADPVAGHAGLVGTQNIRNNESREGGLDHVVKTGTIVEAVENQPWSGEANVHVSIANWVKTQDAKLLPKTRKLWFKVEPSVATKKVRKRGSGPASKQYELDFRECDFISSSLSDATDVSTAKILTCNTEPKCVFEGVQTGHKGFVIDEKEARSLLERDPKHVLYVKPFLNGTDLLSAKYVTHPEFVVDLSELDLLQASAVPDLLRIPKERVLKDWEANAKTENDETGKEGGEHQDRLNYWWALRACLKTLEDRRVRARGLQAWAEKPGACRPGALTGRVFKHALKRPRQELQAALENLPRYIACSAVTKRPVFVFISSAILPTNALKIFAFADDYCFGVIQSGLHAAWFHAKCSNLKSDPRYTPESVFDTFPWPQFDDSPSAARRDIIVEPPAKNRPSSVGATSSEYAAPDGAKSKSNTASYKDAAPDGATPKNAALSRDAIAKIDAVAAAARELRRVRAAALPKLKGGLRALYRTLELPGANPLKDAHAALDTAVLAAYGFSAKKDLLAQLLALNQAVAAKIEKGEPVTAPGVPKHYPDPEKLVTEDCIRPDSLDRISTYADPPPNPTHSSLTPEKSYGDSAHYYSGKEEGPPYRTEK